eukprot:655274-Rhodomonas_salina.2
MFVCYNELDPSLLQQPEVERPNYDKLEQPTVLCNYDQAKVDEETNKIIEFASEDNSDPRTTSIQILHFICAVINAKNSAPVSVRPSLQSLTIQRDSVGHPLVPLLFPKLTSETPVKLEHLQCIKWQPRHIEYLGDNEVDP